VAEQPGPDNVGSSANPLRYDAAGRRKTVPGLINDTAYSARGQQTLVKRGLTWKSFGVR